MAGSLVAVALLVIGLMLVVASVAASDLRSWSGFWRRRSTQAGTNAAVSVLAVLVILGLVNFLGDRYEPSHRSDRGAAADAFASLSGGSRKPRAADRSC